jgi:DNA/RNA endonuclease YhcR with UshA esterase domain
MRAHLGPTNFLTQKGFTFAKGEQIEVTGSSVKYNGADAVIAREVKKGDKTVTLRDKKGVPEWAGRRQST